MKINIILSLLMACSCLVSIPSYAMDSPVLDSNEIEKSGVTAYPSFEEQLKKAGNFIRQRKAQGLHTKMILGAVNTECDRISGEEWIFFDNCLGWRSHKPDGQPFVIGDFNNLNHLSACEEEFGPSLIQLTLDRSTFHCTSWNAKHIQTFASMELPEGECIVPLRFSSGLDTRISSTLEQALERIKEINSLLPGILSSTMTTPLIGKLSNEFLESDRVKAAVAKYDVLQSFLSLPEKELLHKQRELGLPMYRSMVLQDKKLLTEAIAEAIISSETMNFYVRDIFFPHAKAIFEQFFTDVQLADKDAITSWNIVAKNPKR